jgi:hypothetical protein
MADDHLNQAVESSGGHITQGFADTNPGAGQGSPFTGNDTGTPSANRDPGAPSEPASHAHEGPSTSATGAPGHTPH